MTLYKGSQKQGQVKLGNRTISSIYKGNSLIFAADPYKPGVVILEKSVAGTYNFTLKTKRTVQVIMVGAGGGGTSANYSAWHTYRNGGSGAMLQGTITLNAGNYSVTVGAGGEQAYSTAWNATIYAKDGGSTTAFGKTAGGGGGSWGHAGNNKGEDGEGGTATASTGWTATQGKSGDTTGVYNGYGAGGKGNPVTDGKDGYIFIKSI